MNTYDRVTCNPLIGAWGSLTPITLTTSRCVDFFVPNRTDSTMVTAIRKSGAGSLITCSRVGGDGAVQDDPGPSLTWSGGTSAPSVAGNLLSTTQTIGNGFRLTAPVPLWPDWRILRCYIAMSSICQINFSATMNDPAAVASQVGIGGGYDTFADNAAFIGLNTLIVEVKFASDLTGKTMTLDMLRNGGSMSYYIFCGAGLYTAAPLPQSARGSRRAMRFTGQLGPLGSR